MFCNNFLRIGIFEDFRFYWLVPVLRKICQECVHVVCKYWKAGLLRQGLWLRWLFFRLIYFRFFLWRVDFLALPPVALSLRWNRRWFFFRIWLDNRLFFKAHRGISCWRVRHWLGFLRKSFVLNRHRSFFTWNLSIASLRTRTKWVLKLLLLLRFNRLSILLQKSHFLAGQSLVHNFSVLLMRDSSSL